MSEPTTWEARAAGFIADLNALEDQWQIWLRPDTTEEDPVLIDRTERSGNEIRLTAGPQWSIYKPRPYVHHPQPPSALELLARSLYGPQLVELEDDWNAAVGETGTRTYDINCENHRGSAGVTDEESPKP